MKVRIVLGLLLSLWVCPMCLSAQEEAKRHMPDSLSVEQRDEATFLYGFYTAYMSGVLYSPRATIAQVLAEAFTTEEVRRQMRRCDWDIIIDAQDCSETAIRTLYVRPKAFRKGQTWYSVSYSYAEGNFATEVLVRLVKDAKRGYRIAEIYDDEK